MQPEKQAAAEFMVRKLPIYERYQKGCKKMEEVFYEINVGIPKRIAELRAQSENSFLQASATEWEKKLEARKKDYERYMVTFDAVVEMLEQAWVVVRHEHEIFTDEEIEKMGDSQNVGDDGTVESNRITDPRKRRSSARKRGTQIKDKERHNNP